MPDIIPESVQVFGMNAINCRRHGRDIKISLILENTALETYDFIDLFLTEAQGALLAGGIMGAIANNTKMRLAELNYITDHAKPKNKLR